MCSRPKVTQVVTPPPAPPPSPDVARPPKITVEKGATRGRSGKPGGIRNALRIEPSSGLNVRS